MDEVEHDMISEPPNASAVRTQYPHYPRYDNEAAAPAATPRAVATQYPRSPRYEPTHMQAVPTQYPHSPRYDDEATAAAAIKRAVPTHMQAVPTQYPHSPRYDDEATAPAASAGDPRLHDKQKEAYLKSLNSMNQGECVGSRSDQPRRDEVEQEKKRAGNNSNSVPVQHVP